MIWILVATNGFQDLFACPCANDKAVVERILEHVWEMEKSDREQFDISGGGLELSWLTVTDTLMVAKFGIVLYQAKLMEIYRQTEVCGEIALMSQEKQDATTFLLPDEY